MTYLLLCAAFLVIALVAAVVLALRGARTPRTALVVAALLLFALTAVFDNLMIAAGLFSYADGEISGIRIGAAPIEDFAYPLAAVILLPAVWKFLRRSGRDDEETR